LKYENGTKATPLFSAQEYDRRLSTLRAKMEERNLQVIFCILGLNWTGHMSFLSGQILSDRTRHPKILGEFEVLKLKTCSLYHENLFIQKVSDMITQVL
jgi:hypothetical protein